MRILDTDNKEETLQYLHDLISYTIKLEHYYHVNVNKYESLIEKYSNLQQENEKLKEIVENLTTMTVCGDNKQIKNTAQYKLDIYKSRNDKAIEKLKSVRIYGLQSGKTLISALINDVLDILEGYDENGN